MPEYRVLLKASAEKELLRLPDAVLSLLLSRIESLAANPRPPGSKKLRGSRDLWRIRQGDYRAVYRIDDQQLRIEIVRVAHRSDVYS